MIKSCLVFILFMSGWMVKAEVPGGLYYGFKSVDRKVKHRLIQESAWGYNILSSHITDDPFSGILEVMGSFNEGKFLNGQPNTLNVALYTVMFSSFSNSLVKVCDNTPSGQFTTLKFDQMLKTFCEQSAEGRSLTYDSLVELWLEMMGYDADFVEFEAWEDFVNSEEMKSLEPKLRLEHALKAVFLNSHFLIRH